MTEREDLTRMFEYESWASGQWLQTIAASTSEKLLEIFRHNLVAYEIWRERVLGLPRSEYNQTDQERLDNVCTSWKQLLAETDVDQPITFKNLAGEQYTMRFGDIARHVTNHATYHRGQMREVAEREGISFVDTDFSIFTRTP
ncbi:MAG: DinB family protein [Fimbriimonadales bacterium]